MRDTDSNGANACSTGETGEGTVALGAAPPHHEDRDGAAAYPGPDSGVAEIEGALSEVIADIGPMVVAFSGGVDSSLLAVAAHRVLGPDSLAVTADSESLATGELDRCRTLARRWSFEWHPVGTDELTDRRYLANAGDRCYWCKSALMDRLQPIAIERSAIVALGVNVDDLGDHRPGQEAAAGRGARFPLVEAGLAKADVRGLARHWGLDVWDRPAMPCLSSRIPYGTPVSVQLLSRIDRAEAALRAMGFADVRVRHYDDTARIELPGPEFGAAADRSTEIVDALHAVGYRYVTLDLAGLRSGNLNAALSPGDVVPGRS